MRYQDALVAFHENQSRPIDPGILDPDFDLCIRARAAMSQPCFWMKENFGFEGGIPTPQACWMGHILRVAFGPNWFSEIESQAQHAFEDRIAHKLGFENCGEIYCFNDSNTHEAVIREFDARLQAW